MRISEVVHSVPFAEVKPGNIFRFFDKNGALCTGMKVCRGDYEAVLILESHPPYELADVLCLIGETRPWDDDVMLEFPEAVLLRKGFTTLPYRNMPATGELTINDDGKTMLLGKTNGSPLYVDMKTGQAFPSKGVKPPVIVSEWAIALKGDTKECLVEFPGKPAP
jgi:hypothetical protein